jgi:hypothetical protein
MVMRGNACAVALILTMAWVMAGSAQTPETIQGPYRCRKGCGRKQPPALFNQLCAPGYTIQPPVATPRPAPRPRRGAAQRLRRPALKPPAVEPVPRHGLSGTPSRPESSTISYWVGQSEFGAWAVKTSAGIILIDALYDYSVDDEIVGG